MVLGVVAKNSCTWQCTKGTQLRKETRHGNVAKLYTLHSYATGYIYRHSDNHVDRIREWSVGVLRNFLHLTSARRSDVSDWNRVGNTYFVQYGCITDTETHLWETFLS